MREIALEAMHKCGTDITGQMYFVEYPLNDTEEITYGVVAPSGSRGENILEIPEFHAIAAYHYGAYENISESRGKLIAYAKENNLKISGKCRHVYVEGPPQHKDKSKFITQVILPVAD